MGPTGSAYGRPMSQVYLHGHHASVVAAHGTRTAADSAAYLLPHLREGDKVLDVGCGPGTITLDLADSVGGGHVIGIEPVAEPLVIAAKNAADRGDSRTSFVQADVHDAPWPDETFDVVHAHQVLQHLTDPVGALREMMRLAAPGGIVAVRDVDYASMVWFPEAPALTDWLDLYRALARANGAQPDAGRRLIAWAHEAGLRDLTPSASVWNYAIPEHTRWWGESWAQRALHSTFAEQALSRGLATQADLDRISEAWTAWSTHPDAWFAMTHAELLARKPVASR